MMNGTFSAHPWHSMNDFNLDYLANLYQKNEELFIEAIQMEIHGQDQYNQSTQVFKSTDQGKTWKNYQEKLDYQDLKLIHSLPEKSQ